MTVKAIQRDGREGDVLAAVGVERGRWVELGRSGRDKKRFLVE